MTEQGRRHDDYLDSCFLRSELSRSRASASKAAEMLEVLEAIEQVARDIRLS